LDQLSLQLNQCLQAWLQCEQALAYTARQDTPFSLKTIRVLTECAEICRGTMEALSSRSPNLPLIALLCVGLCTECAECCSRYRLPVLHHCAEACQQCACEVGRMLTD